MERIFIIDDDKDTRAIYERFLNLSGFMVLPSARDGNEGIEMFKNFNPKPDIILMDYLMPILNGLKTTKELIKLDENIKIIMISSDTTVENKAIKLGVKIFLPKTVSVAKIIQTIKELLN